MLRKIIQIDQEKCNGCGLCVDACHEGAIGLIGGKATLLRDDYCDGLGDCLPACPTNAISFVKRKAAAYDEQAVIANRLKQQSIAFQCPSSAAKKLLAQEANAPTAFLEESAHIPSCLGQWPCEIKLINPTAPYFQDAHVLIAADCTAFAYANFHKELMAGRITIIGCPKLDAIDYSEKLTQIFTLNDVQSVTIARMEVPCCGGLEHATRLAVANSGKDISLEVVTFTTDGHILK